MQQIINLGSHGWTVINDGPDFVAANYYSRKTDEAIFIEADPYRWSVLYEREGRHYLHVKFEYGVLTIKRFKNLPGHVGMDDDALEMIEFVDQPRAGLKSQKVLVLGFNGSAMAGKEDFFRIYMSSLHSAVSYEGETGYLLDVQIRNLNQVNLHHSADVITLPIRRASSGVNNNGFNPGRKKFSANFISSGVSEFGRLQKLMQEWDHRSMTIVHFGSAREIEDMSGHEFAEELAFTLAEQRGDNAISGGGPGVMSYSNRGAKRGGVKSGALSIGFAIKLPHEEKKNPYLDLEWVFNKFFPRLTGLVLFGDAYVHHTGGGGTLMEAFTVLKLKDIGVLDYRKPIIFVGKRLYEPFMEFLVERWKAGDLIHDPRDLATVVEIGERDKILKILDDFRPYYLATRSAPITDEQLRSIEFELMRAKDLLDHLGPIVSYIGSNHRFKKTSPYAKFADRLAYALAREGVSALYTTPESFGFFVDKGVTAAREEQQAAGLPMTAEGVLLTLGAVGKRNGNKNNDALQTSERYLAKTIIASYSEVVVVFPGGLGTLDYLFEMFVLRQTRKIKHNLMLYLVGGDEEWGRFDRLIKYMISIGTISKGDLKLYHIVDVKNPELLAQKISRSLRSSSAIVGVETLANGIAYGPVKVWVAGSNPELYKNSIVVARELSINEFWALYLVGINGLITLKGNTISHGALLGLPWATVLETEISRLHDGQEFILDTRLHGVFTPQDYDFALASQVRFEEAKSILEREAQESWWQIEVIRHWLDFEVDAIARIARRYGKVAPDNIEALGDFYLQSDEDLIPHRQQTIYRRLELSAAIRLEQALAQVRGSHSRAQVYGILEQYMLWLAEIKNKVLSKTTPEERRTSTVFINLLSGFDIEQVLNTHSKKSRNHFGASKDAIRILTVTRRRLALDILSQDNIGVRIDDNIAETRKFRLADDPVLLAYYAEFVDQLETPETIIDLAQLSDRDRHIAGYYAYGFAFMRGISRQLSQQYGHRIRIPSGFVVLKNIFFGAEFDQFNDTILMILRDQPSPAEQAQRVQAAVEGLFLSAEFKARIQQAYRDIIGDQFAIVQLSSMVDPRLFGERTLPETATVDNIEEMLKKAWLRHFDSEWFALMARYQKWADESAVKHHFNVNRYYPAVIFRELINASAFGYLGTFNPFTASVKQMIVSVDESTAPQNNMDDPRFDTDVVIVDRSTGEIIETRRGDGIGIAFYSDDVKTLFIHLAKAANGLHAAPSLIKFTQMPDPNGEIVILEMTPVLLPGALEDFAVRSTLTSRMVKVTTEGWLKITVRFESRLDLATTDIADSDKTTNPIQVFDLENGLVENFGWAITEENVLTILIKELTLPQFFTLKLGRSFGLERDGQVRTYLRHPRIAVVPFIYLIEQSAPGIFTVHEMRSLEEAFDLSTAIQTRRKSEASSTIDNPFVISSRRPYLFEYARIIASSAIEDQRDQAVINEIERITKQLTLESLDRVGAISLPTEEAWYEYRSFAIILSKQLRRLSFFSDNLKHQKEIEFGLEHGIFNAVIHGNWAGPTMSGTERIWISWNFSDDRYVIEITDEGKLTFAEILPAGVVYRGEIISGAGEALNHMKSIYDQVRLDAVLNQSGVKVGAKLTLVKVASSSVTKVNDITVVHPDWFGEYSAAAVADNIIGLQGRLTRNVNVVLATGNTMKAFLHELAAYPGIDQNRINYYHLDGYRGLARDHPSSFASFLNEHYFFRLQVPAKNIYFVNDAIRFDPFRNPAIPYLISRYLLNPIYSWLILPFFLHQYMKTLRQNGGADIVMLGMGMNGHLAFNERLGRWLGFIVYRGIDRLLLMRPVKLTQETIIANETDYPGIRQVPFAVTMSLTAILESGAEIYFLVNGPRKASILKEVQEGPITYRTPASLLRETPQVHYIFDNQAWPEVVSSSTLEQSEAKSPSLVAASSGIVHQPVANRAEVIQEAIKMIRHAGLVAVRETGSFVLLVTGGKTAEALRDAMMVQIENIIALEPKTRREKTMKEEFLEIVTHTYIGVLNTSVADGRTDTQKVFAPLMALLVTNGLMSLQSVYLIDHQSSQSPQLKAASYRRRFENLLKRLGKTQVDALIGIDENGRWAGIAPHDEKILNSKRSFEYSEKTQQYSFTPKFVLQNTQAVALLSGTNKRWVDIFLTTPSMPLDPKDVPAVLLRQHPDLTVIIDKQARTIPHHVIKETDPVSGVERTTTVYLSAEPSDNPTVRKKQVVVISLHGFMMRAWKGILALASIVTKDQYIFVDVPRLLESDDAAAWNAIGFNEGQRYLMQTALQIQSVTKHFMRMGHPVMIVTHSIGNALFRYMLKNLSTRFKTSPDGPQRQFLKYMDDHISQIPVINGNPFFCPPG
jgi:predicted Rossmann-fold nucleotide-binding protein/6-phosphogluconolactonase/glucosamine-6-phosphate isomerase/deaminase